MPIIGSIGAGSAGGFGQRKGGVAGLEANYLVVAGGGGGGKTYAGGGGGGGMRVSYDTPIAGDPIILPNDTYTITIGAGGTGGKPGSNGTDSSIAGPSIDTFASSGGGRGMSNHAGVAPALPGGSGGGGSPAGTGNIGGYTPAEGFPGGGAPRGGGGGASESTPATSVYAGGDGHQSSISGTAIYYSGGGGGTPPAPDTSHGLGSGPNRGGGGQGGSANGNEGIIIIRAPGDANLTVAPGTNTLTTDGPTGDKIATFTVSGTLVVADA